MLRKGTRRPGSIRLKCLATMLLFGILPVLAASEPVPAAAGQAEVPARITALAVHPQDGTLWIGTARGLVRSADQGRTLGLVALPAKASPIEVTAVVVEPRTPWAIYVATGGEGVFKSEDGGKGWTAVNSGLDGLDIRGLAVAPNDGRLHAQVRSKGLFRSMDGARSWERVDNGPAGTMYTLASVNIPTGMGGIFLYAATDQGLVRGPD